MPNVCLCSHPWHKYLKMSNSQTVLNYSTRISRYDAFKSEMSAVENNAKFLEIT